MIHIPPFSWITVAAVFVIAAATIFAVKKRRAAAGAQTESFVGDCFSSLFRTFFIAFLIQYLFSNLGYFVKINDTTVGYNFIFSVFVFALALVQIFRGRCDNWLLLVGAAMFFVMLLGAVGSLIRPYTKGVFPLEHYDYLVRGTEYTLFVPSFSTTSVKALFNVVRVACIVSVGTYEMKKKAYRNTLLKSLSVWACCAAVYGVIELFLKRVLDFPVVEKVWQPIFGVTSNTLLGTDRMCGLYTESSFYAIYLFFAALILLLSAIKARREQNKKNTIVYQSFFFLVALLMALCTSFVAYGALAVVLFAYFWLYISPKKKGLFAVVFVSIVAAAFLTVGVLSIKGIITNVHLKKAGDVILTFKSIFSGEIADDSSSAARITSWYYALRYFCARPLFGIGVASADVHSATLSLLASTGILGTAAWLYFCLSAARTRKESAAVIAFAIAVLTISGGFGFVMTELYPVLFYLAQAVLRKETKEKRIIINGTNLAEQTRVTGIQRYCIEVIRRIDELLENEKDIVAEYVYYRQSENAVFPAEGLKNIRPVSLKAKSSKTFKLFVLPRYVRKRRATMVAMNPDVCFSRGQLATIYDLRPILYKGYDALNFRVAYAVTLFSTVTTYGKIVTDSEYQKKDIARVLKVPLENIDVVYPGWEHIEQIAEDESVLDRLNVKRGSYFYALGSLAPHKNFQWVLKQAERNPEETFVIAGGKNLRTWADTVETNELKNVIFAGYVTDEGNKALMKRCKAFLHPSKYEGFGIPPLEAMAVGAPVVISNATCLPEIYEDCARYFDPEDTSADLNALLAQPVEDPEKILKKCTWEKAARAWLELMKSTEEEL